MSIKRPVRGQFSTHAGRAPGAASIPPLIYSCALPPGCLPRCLGRPAPAEYVGVGVTLFDTMVRDGVAEAYPRQCVFGLGPVTA